MNHCAFSVQIAKCGQGAAKALLRCRFAAKPVTVSILMSENQPFPPRSFPYGIMNQDTFSDQMTKCGQGAAKALLRCHFAAKTVIVSFLSCENQPFPLRIFPYRNMNQGTFSDQMLRAPPR